MAGRSDDGLPPRLFLPKFLSSDLCKELEFIHKSSSTVGYRPSVFSTTLSHLIATNCPHLIVPLVPVREKLKEKVEEFFGCEYELCIEFTGLISWCKGASIGWHSDDNRPYLRQRDFTAVCYLNTHGKSFSGGLFHFQDGELTTVVPSAGDLLIYTADNRNIHSVDEVTGGERLTLTLWFSRNSMHDEDVKLVSRLSQIYSSVGSSGPFPCLPVPASSNMYLLSRDQSSHQEFGINICIARLLVLGFGIYCSDDAKDLSEPFDLLLKPMRLIRGDEMFDHEFSNILHALQAVQYYFWRASSLTTPGSGFGPEKVTKLSQPQRMKANQLKHELIKDQMLVSEIFDDTDHGRIRSLDFNWAIFSVAVSAWEGYNSEKYKEVLTSLPHWRNHQSLFCISY